MANEVENEGSALEKAQAEERRITLGARDDPNFKLPGGQTVAEVKRKAFETQRTEAAAADKAQGERSVELHKLSEPLANPDAKVVMNKEGGATILPAKIEEPKIEEPEKKSPPPPPVNDQPKPVSTPVTTGKPGDETKT